MSLLIGSNRRSSNCSNGSLLSICISSLSYHSVESNGEQTSLSSTCISPTIGIVRNLKNIGISIVRQPLSVSNRNYGLCTINVNFLTRTISRQKCVIDAKSDWRRITYREYSLIIVSSCRTCKGRFRECSSQIRARS